MELEILCFSKIITLCAVSNYIKFYVVQSFNWTPVRKSGKTKVTFTNNYKVIAHQTRMLGQNLLLQKSQKILYLHCFSLSFIT